MKPVELEIFLQDGVSPGLKKAGQTLSRFSGEAKAELREVSESLKLQKSHVSGMEKEYARLEKALKVAAPGKEWMEAKARLAAYKAELDGEKTALQQLEEQQRKLKAEAEGAGQSLRQQLKNVREEIATLLLAYRSLTDAEKQSAQGRELARHIDELTEKAGELNDALVDTSQAVTNAASDTRAFDQLAGGMQLVVDGFGLATAGAQALGLSEADLVEVQTQLQTALVASNALTSMQVNLQKQSALMQGVNAIQTKAAAGAETIRTWAVGRGVIATKAATVAQAAFNAVAKANPYVLLAMAVVTVVGALYALAKGNEAAKKAEEERQAQLERTKEINEGIARSIGESAGAQIAAYNKLQRAWKALGDDMAKRRKFVDENKKAFRELGLSVNSVKDAEEVLVNNTSNVVQSFILRAKAAALDKAVTQAYSTMLERQDLARRNARYGVKSNGDEVSYAEAKERGMAGVRTVPHEHVRANGGGRSMSSWTTYTYEVSDAQAYNAASNRLALEERDRQIRAASDEAERRVNELQSEIGATEAALESLKIPQMTTPTTTPTSDTTTKDDRIAAARKEADELRKLRWQNEQDEINQLADGAEKRRRQIALDYEKQLAEIDRLRRDFVARNDEAGTQGLNLAGLTDEQQTEIDRANSIAIESRDRALQDMYRMEAQHMADYLKEYGTFQQRRTAIAEEYDRRIAETSDEWSRKTLEREKAATLQNIDIEAIKQSIDWGSVFGDFGTLFRDQLEPTIEKLRAITRTEEFKNTDIEDKQTLYELIARLEQANTSWDSNIFATLGDDLTSYQTALREYMAAQDAERAATETLTEAKKRLAAAEASGDSTAIASATRSVTVATNNLTAASGQVADFGTQVQDASSKLQTSTATVNNMFNSLASNLAGLKSGSLQGVGESLMGLDKLFNNGGVTKAVGGALAKGLSKLLGNSAIGKSVAEALGNSGLLGQIISAILSILDILKDGIGVLVSDLIDTILNAVSGILENLLNGKMFVQIGESLVKGIGGILDVVTFGGFSSLFGSGDSDKNLERDIEYLTTSNKDLQKSIDNLADKMSEAAVSDASGLYEQQKDRLKQAESNTREMMWRAGAAYSNGFLGIGGHHSSNYKIDKGMSGADWDRISAIVGRRIDSAGAFWGLSSEEMAKVFNEANDLYSKIKSLADDGYKNAAQYMDDYIEYYRQLEELQEAYYEKLTGISFDSVRDDFKSKLLDMKSDAGTFIDDLNDMFMNSLVEGMMSEKYTARLKEWYKKFADAMTDGKMTDGELDALRREYSSIVNDALRERDALAGALGIDPDKDGSSQSGRAGSFNALSQDQGTKLEGVFVSVQGHVANIDTVVENVAEKMGAAEGHLAKIEEHTGDSAEALGEIRDMINEIKRDGIKTL